MNTPALTKVEQRDLAMMQEFYLSDWYDPKARNNAAVVAAAIAFARATLTLAPSGEGREAIALRTIAEWPITHPDENMDAFNMALVAKNALAPHKDTSHD